MMDTNKFLKLISWTLVLIISVNLFLVSIAIFKSNERNKQIDSCIDLINSYEEYIKSINENIKFDLLIDNKCNKDSYLSEREKILFSEIKIELNEILKVEKDLNSTIEQLNNNIVRVNLLIKNLEIVLNES